MSCWPDSSHARRMLCQMTYTVLHESEPDHITNTVITGGHPCGECVGDRWHIKGSSCLQHVYHKDSSRFLFIALFVKRSDLVFTKHTVYAHNKFATVSSCTALPRGMTAWAVRVTDILFSTWPVGIIRQCMLSNHSIHVSDCISHVWRTGVGLIHRNFSLVQHHSKMF